MVNFYLEYSSLFFTNRINYVFIQVHGTEFVRYFRIKDRIFFLQVLWFYGRLCITMQYINLFLLTGKRDGLFVSFFSVSVFSFAFICIATSLRLQTRTTFLSSKISLFWGRMKTFISSFLVFSNTMLQLNADLAYQWIHTPTYSELFKIPTLKYNDNTRKSHEFFPLVVYWWTNYLRMLMFHK